MLLCVLIWALTTVNPTVADVIKVDPNHGADNPDCWNGTLSCKSLNFALGGVIHNNTTVELSSGLIDLSISNTTLFDLSDFAIVGNGITATTIQCNNTMSGLSFIKHISYTFILLIFINT